MALTAAKCTQCGADIKVEENKNTVTCEYCRTAFIIDKSGLIKDQLITTEERIEMEKNSLPQREPAPSPRPRKREVIDPPARYKPSPDKRGKSKAFIGLAVIALLAGIWIFYVITSGNDSEAAEALTKCLEERDRFGAEDYDDYQSLLELEEAVLRFKNSKFEDEIAKEFYEEYIRGVEMQRESISFMNYGDQRFILGWRNGMLIRAKAIVELQKREFLNLDEKIYAVYPAVLLSDKIAVSFTSQAMTFVPDASGSYFVNKEVENDTGIDFESVIIGSNWNGIAEEMEITDWKAGEEKQISLKVPGDAAETLKQQVYLALDIISYKLSGDDGLTENQLKYNF